MNLTLSSKLNWIIFHIWFQSEIFHRNKITQIAKITYNVENNKYCRFILVSFSKFYDKNSKLINKNHDIK